MASKKQWLEVLLKKKSYEESPLEVLSMEDASSVVSKGDNYLSEIERVRATVLLRNGKTKKISLIIKKEHSTEQMKKFSHDLGVFFREITMYRDILPKMEDLLNEINDGEEIFWGQCLEYKLYNRLVFEDLNVAGYRMADRKKQLGLESALLVIKNLAKFHALSKILLDRGEIPLDILGKCIWMRDKEKSVKMLTDSGERLIKLMKTWGDDWQEAAERFQKVLPDFGNRFLEEVDPKQEEFVVLIHGDCWTNNMLFKGDDLEKPTSVKFLDWQVSFVCTPARDLYYFLTTSVRLDVRKQHIDEIIQMYADSLKFYTSKLNYEGYIPDVDSIKDMLKNKVIFTVENALGIVPIVTGDTSDAPDMEDLAKGFSEAEEKGEKVPDDLWNPFKYMTPITEAIIKDVMKNAMELGAI